MQKERLSTARSKIERWNQSTVYWKSTTQAFIESLLTYEVRVEVAPSILPKWTFTDRFVQIVEVGSINQEDWIPFLYNWKE